MSRSEAIPGIEARMAALEAGVKGVAREQANILAALDLMLDTLRTQSQWLQELATLAKDDPESSPLSKSLDEMRAAILTVDGTLARMAERLEDLPQQIGRELERRRASDRANAGGAGLNHAGTER